MSISKFKNGLVVESLGESQANIFFDDRIYCVQEDGLRIMAEKVAEEYSGAIDVYLGGFKKGCIVVIENLARRNNNYALAEVVARICDYVAKRSIFPH